jgi:hypothetical protein
VSLRPTVLAIQGGFAGADLEDFTNALFGRDVERGAAASGVSVEPNPPWAAVLAFPSVSAASAADPVLFMAPRYKGPPLPAAFQRLEVRRLAGSGVEVQPTQETDVWIGMRWAQAEGRSAG